MTAIDTPSLLSATRLRVALLAALALLAVCQTGCVRRRMTIRSNPPGAKVYVDDQEIGVTPVSTNFTYYATRTITLIKDGYRTEKTQHRVLPTWYQIPGVDFFSENLYPRELRDERVVDFQLVPQENIRIEDLMNRANALRENAQAGTVSPLLPDQLAPQPEQLPPPVGLPGQGLPDNAPLPYSLPPPVNPLGAARNSPFAPGPR